MRPRGAPRGKRWAKPSGTPRPPSNRSGRGSTTCGQNSPGASPPCSIQPRSGGHGSAHPGRLGCERAGPQAAQEAEQRKTAATVAYRAVVQAQDGDRGVTEAQGSVFDPVVPQAPQDAPAEGVDPFSGQPVTTDSEGEEKAVPSAGPTGATRKTWIVEILDTDKLRAALIALPAGDKLQAVLRVHEPTLRKMLANELGPDKAESAFPAGCVSVRSEDRAVRSRHAMSGHTCHWPGCTRQVPPRLWGCPRHWWPEGIRTLILTTYRHGQEIDKDPSWEYLEAAMMAERFARGMDPI